MLKLENKQKCNSRTCWQWDFVKIMIQQNFPPTVAWQQSRQSTVGDEVEQVFLLRRRWSFNCPPPNNLPQSRHHTANCSEITFTVTTPTIQTSSKRDVKADVECCTYRMNLSIMLLFRCHGNILGLTC